MALYLSRCQCSSLFLTKKEAIPVGCGSVGQDRVRGCNVLGDVLACRLELNQLRPGRGPFRLGCQGSLVGRCGIDECLGQGRELGIVLSRNDGSCADGKIGGCSSDGGEGHSEKAGELHGEVYGWV